MLRPFVLAIILSFHPLWLWANAPESPPVSEYKFGMSENDASTVGGYLTEKVYREAFKRMGTTVKIVKIPLKRITQLVLSGELDGEVARVYEYSNNYPSLVRVEESVIILRFSIFTTHSELKYKNLKSIPINKYQIAYRRGINVCEQLIRDRFPENNFDDVSLTEQGLKQLKLGRIDFFCDIENSVWPWMQSKEFKTGPAIKILFDIKTVPTYAYMNGKHKDLAQKLAAVIKDIKKEGLYEKYSNEAKKELILYLAQSQMPEPVKSKPGDVRLQESAKQEVQFPHLNF